MWAIFEIPLTRNRKIWFAESTPLTRSNVLWLVGKVLEQWEPLPCLGHDTQYLHIVKVCIQWTENKLDLLVINWAIRSHLCSCFDEEVELLYFNPWTYKNKIYPLTSTNNRRKRNFITNCNLLFRVHKTFTRTWRLWGPEYIFLYCIWSHFFFSLFFLFFYYLHLTL